MGAGSDPADNNQLFKNNVFGSLKSLGHDVNLIHFDHFLSVINESDKKTSVGNTKRVTLL